MYISKGGRQIIMKISIITPAYNCEKYIVETIDSVLAQTYIDWEMLIIDDCSTDDTVKIIKTYNDKRIKYYKTQNNIGAFGARNIGIEKAVGDFICFLDSDDIWTKDKLQKQLKFMKNNRCDVSTHGYDYINETGNKIKGTVVPLKQFTLQSYMGNTCINIDTVMLNTKSIDKIYFKDIKKREDAMYWIDVLGHGHIIMGMDDIMASYRLHRGQISGNKIEMALRTFKFYMTQPYVNKLSAMICFVKYIINAILKRI